MSARILVVGWYNGVEDALDRAGIPHVTLVQVERYPEVHSRADDNRVLLPCSDITSIEALLGAVHRSQASVSDLVAVWTTNEFAVVPAAALAQSLGLRTCSDVFTALAFRDKAVQKRVVAQAGLPVARTALLACETDLTSADVAAVGFPAVFKPVAGGGTAHTHRVDDAAELAGRLATLLETAPGNGPFLLESFVPGSEMHLDGCLTEGRLASFAASRYVTNLLEIGTGGIAGSYMIDPVRDAQLHAETEKFTLACLQALGLTDGIFHMEVFVGDDGLYFSECGARAGGGGIVEAFEAKLGLHLIEEGVKNAAGLPPGVPDVAAGVFGWTQLRARPGIAVEVPSTEELLARAGVVKGAVDQVVGQPTPDMTQNTALRAGYAIVSAPTEQEWIARVEDLRAWFADAVVTEGP